MCHVIFKMVNTHLSFQSTKCLSRGKKRYKNYTRLMENDLETQFKLIQDVLVKVLCVAAWEAVTFKLFELYAW